MFYSFITYSKTIVLYLCYKKYLTMSYAAADLWGGCYFR